MVKDEQKAVGLYLLAAAQGHETAQARLNRLTTCSSGSSSSSIPVSHQRLQQQLQHSPVMSEEKSSMPGVTIENGILLGVKDSAIVNGCFTIPNSVTHIGDSAFYGCKSLTQITIPNCVNSIGSEAFYFCNSLMQITIPNSVTSIGRGAFQGCKKLTAVTIPNSVTSIGGDAFSGCEELTAVTIPNSVTVIGERAFNRCVCLEHIDVDSDNPSDLEKIKGFLPEKLKDKVVRQNDYSRPRALQLQTEDHKKATCSSGSSSSSIPVNHQQLQHQQLLQQYQLQHQQLLQQYQLQHQQLHEQQLHEQQLLLLLQHQQLQHQQLQHQQLQQQQLQQQQLQQQHQLEVRPPIATPATAAVNQNGKRLREDDLHAPSQPSRFIYNNTSGDSSKNNDRDGSPNSHPPSQKP